MYISINENKYCCTCIFINNFTRELLHYFCALLLYKACLHGLFSVCFVLLFCCCSWGKRVGVGKEHSFRSAIYSITNKFSFYFHLEPLHMQLRRSWCNNNVPRNTEI